MNQYKTFSKNSGTPSQLGSQGVISGFRRINWQQPLISVQLYQITRSIADHDKIRKHGFLPVSGFKVILVTLLQT